MQVVDLIVVLAVIGLTDQLCVLPQVAGIQQVHQVLGALHPLLHLTATIQHMVSQKDRKCVCVCVCVCGGGVRGGRGVAEPIQHKLR